MAWPPTTHQDVEDTVDLLWPAASMFTPAAVGQWYSNPLMPGVRTLAVTLNRLHLHALYSGPTAITINPMDVTTTVAAGAGGLIRVGIYTITDQENPFTWTAGVAWAGLLVDAGTIDTTTTAGQKTITLGTPQVVPARTWFAVGGVDQVAAPTRNVGGTAGAARFSPLGSPTAAGFTGTIAISLYQDSVSGALPSTFTPANTVNVDSGVGIRRSA